MKPPLWKRGGRGGFDHPQLDTTGGVANPAGGSTRWTRPTGQSAAPADDDGRDGKDGKGEPDPDILPPVIPIRSGKGRSVKGDPKAVADRGRADVPHEIVLDSHGDAVLREGSPETWSALTEAWAAVAAGDFAAAHRLFSNLARSIQAGGGVLHQQTVRVLANAARNAGQVRSLPNGFQNPFLRLLTAGTRDRIRENEISSHNGPCEVAVVLDELVEAAETNMDLRRLLESDVVSGARRTMANILLSAVADSLWLAAEITRAGLPMAKTIWSSLNRADRALVLKVVALLEAPGSTDGSDWAKNRVDRDNLVPQVQTRFSGDIPRIIRRALAQFPPTGNGNGGKAGAGP